jgi:hypothetical protein
MTLSIILNKIDINGNGEVVRAPPFAGFPACHKLAQRFIYVKPPLAEGSRLSLPVPGVADGLPPPEEPAEITMLEPR